MLNTLAPRPSQQDWPPHGLVSLWDMLEIDGASFHQAVSALAALEAFLDGRAVSKPPDKNKKFEPPEEMAKVVLSFLKTISECCPAFGARITEMAVDRVRQGIKAGIYRETEVPRKLEEIRSRMQDELTQAKLFALNDSEAKFYAETLEMFGDTIVVKFDATVLEDIDEAGKCLALGRPTASVFHLMRVAEAALQAFAGKLDVTLPETKVWQILLDQVNKAIKALPPKDPATIAYAEIAAHLYNVKLAWRNEVMHPKETYTPEQATEVLNSVRGFLVNLAAVL